MPLLTPFALYASWAVVLRLRLGFFPNHSHDRLSLPATGFVEALRRAPDGHIVVLWVVFGLVLTLVAVVRRPRDVLTWIVVAVGTVHPHWEQYLQHAAALSA